jgi:probable HAF family extracellular repeat protein
MRQMARYRLYALLSVCVAFLLATDTGWSQPLTWLGVLPGQSSSFARRVSEDGSTVVGSSYYPFRWTRTTGMQQLATYRGLSEGVTADGSVVVGWLLDDIHYRAFRWTAQTGTVILSRLPDASSSVASDITPDGRWIFGDSNPLPCCVEGHVHAVRWDGNTLQLQDLGFLSGYGLTKPWSAAANGAACVGSARQPHDRAFRWTESGGMQDLGTLGGQQSDAWDVSADGTVVVGRAQDSSNQWRAFIWREGIGMQALPTPSGWSASVAFALAADGTIVGTAVDASGQWHATRWTTNGFENLNQTYAWLLLGGSRLIEARDISANGRYIVGTGYNAATGREEAFLLDTTKLAVIRGTLTLGDYGGDPSLVPVSVRLRKEGGSEETRTIFTDRNGNYSLWLEPGTYEVSFKASHWLRVNLTGVTLGPAEEVTGQDATLTNGDIDGDNEVTLFDFGRLVAAFGSMPGYSNWNPDADLDGDDEVTLFDFGILVQNFGAIGDE